MSKKDLAILILAAGSSKRLGQAKQLVKYKNESLLEISVKKALRVTTNVFVVLGHEKQKCEKEISKYDVNILYNKNYEDGIGSSLSFGIENTKEYENTLVTLCDQPFIPLNHFFKLTKEIDKNKIITTKYSTSQNSTVPAIFPKKYYNELIKLNCDFGAKELLKNTCCCNIELDKSLAVDIDTIEDIYKYIENNTVL